MNRASKIYFLVGTLGGLLIHPIYAQNEAKPSPSKAEGAASQPSAPAAQVPNVQDRSAFEFLEGDRVVLLGDTLIEREQTYGFVECRLLSRYPDRNLIFRNLGWSADTLLGESRAGFDPPEKGFDRLKGHLAAVKPTVAILGYGMASSFAGEAGLPKFKDDLNKLMDAIKEISPQVRFILLSPIRHEKLPSPLPDPARHNEQLTLYSKAIREIAEQRGGRFVPLLDLLGDGMATNPPFPLTDNGIHLNAAGYWRLATAIELGLGWSPSTWRAGITSQGTLRRGSQSLKVENLEKRTNYVRFKGTSEFLESPIPSGDEKELQRRTTANLLQFVGMAPGAYVLKVDGQPIITLPEADWSKGQRITSGGPSFEQAEKLRQTVVRKNELYFYRWRPQNETYLLGFRKYEQGQNAREIVMFDPLVAEQEAKIAELRKPVSHIYELALVENPNPNPAPGKEKPRTLTPSANTAPVKTDSAVLLDSPPGRGTDALPQFQIAEGFEITLFAENPHLAKPIQINFDPQGRLWIASSSVYPQIQPGQVANDKILVLEDTDNDGKADKSTVFADGLLIPTGLEPGDGGVYVGQSTELLHFKDTDGDGKADQRRVVLSGFGTEDTHHILHTLRWGLDGQLYFNQSIYIHSHIETPHGVVRLNSGGIMHLRPPTMELGIFLKGFVNSWGHDFDDFGQSFATDGAGGQGINYGVPGAMYVTYAGARRILGSVSPGSYPKFCSLEILNSEHFPPDWQGNMITCDFRAHRIVRFAISEQGSAYVTKEMPDLLRTTDVTFRPIDVKLGPDGALYVSDWSNPIIQHGEVDFRDPRRDHEHGRIWRITAKGRPLVPKPRLIDAPTSQLFDQLLSLNDYNRQQTRRVLTERGQSIAADLGAWTKKQASEKALLEALWMYQSIDVVEPSLLDKLLLAQDGRIRAAATRVIRFWHHRLNNPIDLLALRIADEHPRVRLEAMRALSQIPSARSAELVLGALDKPMDSFLDYGVWLSINDLAKPWIEAVQSGAWKVEGREKQLEFGLQAIEPGLAGSVLGGLLQARTLARDGSGPWIELIGKAGTEKELRQLFDLVLKSHFDQAASARALVSLGQAARLRKAKPSGELMSVAELLTSSDEQVRAEAIRLAGYWKLRGLTPQLLRQAADNSAASRVLASAFEGLREMGGGDVVNGLKSLASKNQNLSIRSQAAQTLAMLDLQQAMPSVIEVLSQTTGEPEALAFWRSLLSNKGAATAAARALPKSGFPSVVAKAGLRAAREGGRNEPDLILALARSGNLEDDARNLTPAEIKQMVATMTQIGDPARGEKIYRRADLACLTCHSIGGVGGKAGPDMTSLGASAQPDYLIESILYPNRKVKEGFHSIVVETKDGQEFSGIPVRENTEQLVIRDASNKEISLAKNNIEKRAVGGSIMPSGLIDVLSNNEQMDLYRFLSELGKPGRYDASKGNVARSWKLFAQTIDTAQFGDDRVLMGNLNDRGWSQAYAFVDGHLPKEELQSKLRSAAGRDPSAIYAATQFQVANAAKVRMEFSANAYLGLWIDGKPVTVLSMITADLSNGLHTFVVKMDARKLPEHLRLETSDGTFLTN